ncbi:Centromere protein P [Heterocephalus glaber]|uniref:Centromere protein P n=1 Tax=Heterocephalus glaber TaxID=10181 RepID=G5BQK5_HETGA|nr:Centromere protein P [Heterocephalus glaber]
MLRVGLPPPQGVAYGERWAPRHQYRKMTAGQVPRHGASPKGGLFPLHGDPQYQPSRARGSVCREHVRGPQEESASVGPVSDNCTVALSGAYEGHWEKAMCPITEDMGRRKLGFELVIVWRIQIDEEGKVSPVLDLLTKIPQRALELDKNRVIETAPLSFRTLLGVLGIEAAVECLIRLLHAGNE